MQANSEQNTSLWDKGAKIKSRRGEQSRPTDITFQLFKDTGKKEEEKALDTMSDGLNSNHPLLQPAVNIKQVV